MSCDCEPGKCKRFGFTGRRADICAGRVLTPAICAAYRQLWAGGAVLQQVAGEVVSFATAHARWVAAGSPVRDPLEVANIFEVCAACPLVQFTETAGVAWCRKCGCRLAAAGSLMNKIAMATESCPEGHW